jgi:hypothetical protein
MKWDNQRNDKLIKGTGVQEQGQEALSWLPITVTETIKEFEPKE